MEKDQLIELLLQVNFEKCYCWVEKPGMWVEVTKDELLSTVRTLSNQVKIPYHYVDHTIWIG